MLRTESFSAFLAIYILNWRILPDAGMMMA
jgi:hypothetical protein